MIKRTNDGRVWVPSGDVDNRSITAVRVEVLDAATDYVKITTNTTKRYASDTTLRVEFVRKNVLHRTDGPAVVEIDENGTAILEEYLVDGMHHRDGGLPAVVRRSHQRRVTEGGPVDAYTVIEQAWFYCGHLHRDDDLPAIVSRPGLGHVQLEWYTRGSKHRPAGGPAEIDVNRAIGTAADLVGVTVHLTYTNEAGKEHSTDDHPSHVVGTMVIPSTDFDDDAAIARITSEHLTVTERRWMRDGVAHRDGGPVWVRGKAYEWKRGGQFHRTDGPCKYTPGWGNGPGKAEYCFRDGPSLNPTSLATVREHAREMYPTLRRSAAFTLYEMDRGLEPGLLSSSVTPDGQPDFSGTKRKRKKRY